MGKRGGSKGRAQKQGLPKAKRQKKESDVVPKTGYVSDDDSEEALATPYEYEEATPDEEVRKNRRYDDVDVYEYELPEDFEDEEIDEDAAFTEEDKVRFGNLFADGSDGEPGDESPDDDASDDVDLNSEDGDSDVSEEYNPDDFSDEEVGADRANNAGRKGKDVVEENMEGDDDFEGESEPEGSEGESEEGQSESEDDDLGDGNGGEDERHKSMLQAVMDQGRGKGKEKRGQVVVSEAVPESEFSLNPSAGTAGGGGKISVADLMGSLDRSAGNLGALKKRLEKVESGAGPVSAPLPRVIKERIERQAGYEHTKSDIAKWQPLVKANREAPTIVFSADKKGEVVQLSTAGMAAKFVPTTDLEKEISGLLKESGVEDGRSVEAGETLELNKLTVEEVLARKERLAKMRSLLFQHESKAKRVKKIKSKAFHRAAAKARAKERAKHGGGEADRDAEREEALKEEFKRAQERMTLKHKNTSKWAKRALKRGLTGHVEDGTRDAIAEQLRMHEALTRKVDRMDDRDSSDASSSEDDDDDVTEDVAGGEAAEGLQLARETARDNAAVLRVLEDDEEGEKPPRKGLLALPFMARALDRKRQEARDEAMALLEELEHRQDPTNTDATPGDDETVPRGISTSGRMTFSAAPGGGHKRADGDISDGEDGAFEGESDLEGGSQSEEETGGRKSRRTRVRGNNGNGEEEAVTIVLPEEGAGDQIAQVGVSGGYRAATEGPLTVGDGGRDPSEADVSRMGADVSMGRSGSEGRAHGWLFANGGGVEAEANGGGEEADGFESARTVAANGAARGGPNGGRKGGVNGVTIAGTSVKPKGPKAGKASSRIGKGTVSETGGEVATLHENGGLPASVFLEGGEGDSGDEGGADGELLRTELSQAELVRRAFAGDDVEADFEARKAELLDEEVPAIEGPVTLPGWGQWTGVQKKKGLPGWIVKERKDNEKKRKDAMAKRQDAGRKHVIISEKWDKKAAKYSADGVPFPFKDREAFERSLRNPLGREYNTDSAHRDMIRPSVIKSTGIIIDPIKYVKPEQKGKVPKPGVKKSGKGSGKNGKKGQNAAKA